MSTTQKTGAPFNENAQVVIETTVAYTIRNSDNQVVAIGGALTFTLPDNPRPGQRHLLVAAGGAITVVAGSGATLSGSKDTVPASGSAEYVYVDTGTVWVPTVAATT